MTAHRARVLLVDDRPENLLALEAILEPLGQELVRANSGEEALRLLLRGEYAVILLDVQMPGMSGFETAEVIKSRERSRHVPIIFLTAINKDDKFVFQGYSVGAVDYMFKPLHAEVLRSKVAVFVELSLKNTELQAKERALREAERQTLELQHNARLQETQAKSAEIIGAVTEAIITIAPDQRITMVNPGAARMFGVDAAKMVGHPFTDFLVPASRSPFSHGLDTLLAPDAVGPLVWGNAKSSDELLLATRADGEEFPFEATLSRVVLPTETLLTLVGRDVSERRKAELQLRTRSIELANATEELQAVNEELQRRQLELEKAMLARSRFYASMSHELRTPINAILGYSSLLLDNVYGPLNERQINGIERTNRAAKHLLELVNDVLDLSKIEAGKIELQLESIGFPSLIEDLFVTVRPLADEHGSTLSSQHEGDPINLISDPRRVRQILLNLLSNAIKFGRGRPIRLASRPWSRDGLEIVVEDEGIGIHEEDLNKIFDEFVQLSRPDRQDGTGLGLPISQRLARLLGGSLVVESEVNVGSKFTLRLPRSVDIVPGPEDQALHGAIQREAVAAGVERNR